MARSMSFAARLIRPFCAVINTLDRIGMVFRRSTTLWTWARAFKSAARSIVSFMVWVAITRAVYAVENAPLRGPGKAIAERLQSITREIVPESDFARNLRLLT